MIKEAIALLTKKEDLTNDMVEQVMGEIMTGEATDAQKAAFLTALSMKGETRSQQQQNISEITANILRMTRTYWKSWERAETAPIRSTFLPSPP